MNSNYWESMWCQVGGVKLPLLGSVSWGQRHEFEVAISSGQPQQQIEDLAREQGATGKRHFFDGSWW